MTKSKKSNLEEWLGENHLTAEAGGPTGSTFLEQLEAAIREHMGIKNLSLDPVKQTIRFAVSGDHTEISTLFEYDADRNLLTIQNYFSYKDSGKFDSVLILSSLRNRWFVYGNEIAYPEYYIHRSYLFVPEQEFDFRRAALVALSGINTVDEAFPLVMMVVYGGKNPHEVIEEALNARKKDTKKEE